MDFGCRIVERLLCGLWGASSWFDHPELRVEQFPFADRTLARSHPWLSSPNTVLDQRRGFRQSAFAYEACRLD
jgi:hypothetical protein